MREEIREDITSFMIAYFRSLQEFEFELGDANPESALTESSTEDKPDSGSDSVEDKPNDEETKLGDDEDDRMLGDTEEEVELGDYEDEPMLGDTEEDVELGGNEDEVMLGDDDEEVVDSDEDIEGPWYTGRKDVKLIGDVLVGFFMEKLKLSLREQAAYSYVAGKNVLTERHQHQKRLLDQREYPVFNVEDADKAILVSLVKLLLSEADAAVKATLETLVNNYVKKIAEKMRPVIVLEYIEAKKKRWIEQCGTHDVDQLIAYSCSKKQPFYINVAGSYEKDAAQAGFGVIIREFRGNPLLAYSENLPDKETQVSLFYHELQGVNKGLELAIELGLEYFLMFTTLGDVGYLVMSCQAYEDQCRCDPESLKSVEKRCESCVRRCVMFCQEVAMDDSEIEMIYNLLIQVMNKLLVLDRLKVSVMGQPSYNTGSVKYLSNLKENKGKIKPADLKHYPELQELLFNEASGELGLDVFSISLFCQEQRKKDNSKT